VATDAELVEARMTLLFKREPCLPCALGSMRSLIYVSSVNIPRRNMSNKVKLSKDKSQSLTYVSSRAALPT